MNETKDTREETKSRRWLAIYGAYIAVQVQERIRLTGDAYISIDMMKGFMEEAACIADLEVEAGLDT
jgi:hypothetical protein